MVQLTTLPTPPMKLGMCDIPVDIARISLGLRKGVCDFSSWLNLRLSLETENSSTEHGIPNHDNIGSDIFNMVILCLARRGGKFNLSVRLVENLILSG